MGSISSQSHKGRVLSSQLGGSIALKQWDIPRKCLKGSYKLDIPHLLSEMTRQCQENPQHSGLDVKEVIEFLRQLQPWSENDDDGLLKQAQTSLQTVTILFPQSLPGHIRFCQVVWFAAFVLIDDILESVSLEEGQDCLFTSMEMINSCPKMAFAGMVHTQHILLNTLTLEAPASNLSKSDQVHHALYTVCKRLQTTLDPELVTMLFKDILNTFIGFGQEVPYRRRKSHCLDSYAEIRRKTIGIAPFITLTNWSILGRPLQYGHLERLSDLVKRILGLQNDLIGLEKDLKVGEYMNSVVIASSYTQGQHGPDIFGKVVVEAQHRCQLHNTLAAEAMEIANEFLADLTVKVSTYEKWALVDTVLLLVQRHLQWCVSAKRYEATQLD